MIEINLELVVDDFAVFVGECAVVELDEYAVSCIDEAESLQVACAVECVSFNQFKM